jgi:hypothetical protein
MCDWEGLAGLCSRGAVGAIADGAIASTDADGAIASTDGDRP